jgi:phosphinothricin acetyltransferase
MAPEDWPAIARIYVEGIATGVATFETRVPDWSTWDRGHLAAGRRVARAGAEVIGWAALSPVSERCVYHGVAELSVYVAARARGGGVGRELLRAVVEDSEAAGLWTLQAGVMAGNAASLALFTSEGFRTVGLRERLGCLDGRWCDVVLLERRSGRVGC